ncbi:MAG: Rieske 2Fe-2S domain-containing protein [Candidatus Kapaibacteriota bacterium]
MNIKKQETQTRREFLRYVGSFFASGLIISSTYPILTSCEKDESLPAPPPGSNITIFLKDHPELNTFPSIKKFTFQTPVNISIIVKRIAEKKFLVFSGLCPHQGVDLELPKNADGNLLCPRHKAEFSTSEATGGKLAANPQGVKVGDLPLYQTEFDPERNVLIIKLS